jgi:hypothetical protein
MCERLGSRWAAILLMLLAQLVVPIPFLVERFGERLRERVKGVVVRMLVGIFEEGGRRRRESEEVK